MDDGDGESVGGVVGLRERFEAEMEANHFLDLVFMGMTVATNGHFNLVGGIFENGEMTLLGD